MPVVLAVSDEVDRALAAGGGVRTRPDLVVACGDLPFDYLEDLAGRLGAPLVFVPGNHDPAVGLGAPPPPGCTNADGMLVEVAGLRIAGLGGSIRYRPGANQYSQDEMRQRAEDLERLCRVGLPPSRPAADLFLAHSPPFGLGDEDDPPHRGFEAFTWLLDRLQPAVMAHGHVHPYGRPTPDRLHGPTRIVNVIPRRLFTLDA